MSENLDNPNKKTGSGTPERSTYKPSAKVAQNPDFKIFQREMIKERDNAIAELKKAGREKLNAASAKLDPRAKSKFEDVLQKQELDLYYFFRNKIDEYARSIENKNTNLQELAGELRESASKKAKTRVDNVKTILKNKIKGSEITTENVLEIETALQVMEEFEKNHPELNELMDRVVNRNAGVEDYKTIATYLNPRDMSGKARESGNSKDPLKLFDATTAGAFLGSMDDSQRMDFTRVFMQTVGQKEHTAEYLESMLSMGLLNKVNGQIALDEAKELGLITDTEYHEKTKKLNDEVYEQKEKEYKREIENELKTFYRGRYSRNVVDRTFGKPLLGLLGMTFGAATLALNTMVAKGNPAAFLKNPYWYAGLSATVFGTEAFFGSLKKDVLIGGGPVAEIANKFGDTDEKKEGLKKNEKEFRDIYLKGPKEVRLYLNEGGFATILELKTEINKDKTRNREINVKDLIEMEKSSLHGKNKERNRLLEQMNTPNGDKDRKSTVALTRITNLAVTLNITNSAEMKAKLDRINQEQKGSLTI